MFDEKLYTEEMADDNLNVAAKTETKRSSRYDNNHMQFSGVR
jgi:hypothetical protein